LTHPGGCHGVCTGGSKTIRTWAAVVRFAKSYFDNGRVGCLRVDVARAAGACLSGPACGMAKRGRFCAGSGCICSGELDAAKRMRNESKSMESMIPPSLRLVVVGLNHRTAPLALREQIAFNSIQTAEALRQLNAAYPDAETVIL